MTMPITQGQGNLLTQDVDALVNTVNTEGVMGKGIALQFKRAWPEMFKAYQTAAKRGEVVPGRMHVWATGLMTGPRFIINFPTKRHWRSSSKLSDIDAGLDDLVHVVREHGITSIAIPPLGCGNGGLAWHEVEPLIRTKLEPIGAATRVVLYHPGNTPAARDQPNAEPAPRLTSQRAAILMLMHRFTEATFGAPTPIATQKLAYFLQNRGEDLRLRFVAHNYGPYADALRKSLRAMEGHYIDGFGDGSGLVTDAAPMEVRREVWPQLEQMLAQDGTRRSRVCSVLDDIEGFESQYGLELLATVHWIMSYEPGAFDSADRTYAAVHEWSARKANLFTHAHVAAAWNAVRDRDLVTSS